MSREQGAIAGLRHVMLKPRVPLSDYFQELTAAMKLAGEGRHDEAVARLERGLELAREHGAGRHIATLARNAGLLSLHSGSLEAAIAYFSQVLATCPEDLGVHALLVELYEHVGKPELAEEHLRRFEELATSTDDPDNRELLAAFTAQRRARRG